MSVAETFDPQTIRVAPSAISKINELISEEGNPALKLRVYITGGGCSGFQYGFAFEEEVADDDSLFANDKVIVDSMSYQYLVGSELDYTEGLEGSKFVIHNPNAVTTCGCGASFSL
ncbi:MAG: iron-sulfur cluster insertion protein ErpA [Aequoribacter sp.]|jgi:iron-sulfur cluster insertion protein|uniref:Iron-sulfur cluster insertion protein ErpA n=1 Tax=Aequoribacter fuscus TaxID=2518989 RepID=F3L5M5_9GAMM|nr:iron-sulfur cluster insertion protein ErpA [Aequoribacter fuscus]EGG28368.1 putative iron binding protein from the HesB_IscA_SufA family [Aequoribacter fuscus]QHJ86924.1 iron-sulfur cluster insertion protein ErpA [Aequoribacter fuscus]